MQEGQAGTKQRIEASYNGAFLGFLEKEARVVFKASKL